MEVVGPVALSGADWQKVSRRNDAAAPGRDQPVQSNSDHCRPCG
jgi:hypothetical protein